VTIFSLYGCASGYSAGFRWRIVWMLLMKMPSSMAQPLALERLVPPIRNTLLSR